MNPWKPERMCFNSDNWVKVAVLAKVQRRQGQVLEVSGADKKGNHE